MKSYYSRKPIGMSPLKKQYREYAEDCFGRKIKVGDVVVFYGSKFDVAVIVGLSKTRVRVWTELGGEDVRIEHNLLKVDVSEVPSEKLKQFENCEQLFILNLQSL